MRCLVENCESTFSSPVQFYRLPDEQATCSEWLTSLDRPDLLNCPVEFLLNEYFVCSLHFQVNDDDIKSESIDQDSLGFQDSTPDSDARSTEEDEFAPVRPSCNSCKKSFNDLGDILKHFEIGCPVLGVICKEEKIEKTNIKMEFNYGTYKRHTQVIKKYKCAQCGKAFANTTGLRNHLSIHTGHRPYKCDMCDKKFVLMSCLKTHINTIHTGKKYECLYCKKTYQSEHYLKTHIRIHNEEKNFQCHFCVKKFVDMQALKLHIRTHTGEKPYKCTYCDKMFAQQSHLKTHVRIHTGDKPFKCEKCDRRFRQLSNVQEHQRVHLKAALKDN